LSQGAFTVQGIEAMELTIVRTLQWRLNPPSSLSFVRELVNLIPESQLSDRQQQEVYDLSKYQTEVAVVEQDFARLPASTIAFVALASAMDSLHVDISLPLQRAFGSLLFSDDFDPHNEKLLDLRARLCDAVVRQRGGAAAGDTSVGTPCAIVPSLVAHADGEHQARKHSIPSSPRSATDALAEGKHVDG
jgi:hypothetical protein